MKKFAKVNNHNVSQFFTGVVEDRLDPLKLNRVRVRIHGIHSEDKTLIPTEHLPWAFVLSPTTSASVSGVGESDLGLVEGSWVLGIFQDGDSKQKPIVLGSFFGIPEEPSRIEEGFFDPRTEEELEKYPRKPEEFLNGVPWAYNFPKVSAPLGNEISENDLNRLSRNEFVSESIISKKNESRTKNVETALGLGGIWDEPNSRYNASYPFNHVFESESGHLREVDDTPGAERLHTVHRSMTSEEIAPDGPKVTRVVKNNYEIVFGDNFINVKGVSNITTEGNFNLLSKGSIHIESKTNLALYVHENVDIRVDGDMILNVKGGDLDINVEDGDLVVNAQNVSLDVQQNLVARVGGDSEIHTEGNLDLLTDGDVFHKVGGNYDLHVDGYVDIRGNPIKLNPDKA